MTNYISPCKGVCLLDPEKNECIGCYRTAYQIQYWNTMSAEEKGVVLYQCKEKEQRREQRRRDEIRYYQATNVSLASQGAARSKQSSNDRSREV